VDFLHQVQFSLMHILFYCWLILLQSSAHICESTNSELVIAKIGLALHFGCMVILRNRIDRFMSLFHVYRIISPPQLKR
jgi:hypothetical protein